MCGGVAEEEERGEEGLRKCLAGCKAKAMPSTRFCNTRILSDSRQMPLKTLSDISRSSDRQWSTCCLPVFSMQLPAVCHLLAKTC